MSLYQPAFQKLKFVNKIKLSLLKIESRSELCNLDNFAEVSRGIWQNFLRKTVGPTNVHRVGGSTVNHCAVR